MRDVLPSRNAWRMHLLLLVVQGFALAAVAMFRLPIDGLPLDDAWIHQVIARNGAEHGVLGFDLARPGSAATSLLWAMLLSLKYRLLDVSPAYYALSINAVLYVGAGQLLFGALRADGVAPVLAWCAAALFSLAGNWVWFAFSGMEATLIAFLLIAAVAAWFSRGAVTAATTGVSLGLAVLTRPEAVALVPVLLVLGARRRGWRDVLLAALPVTAAVLAYVAFNVAVTGDPLPPTLAGRRWMWLFSASGASRAELVGLFLERWGRRVAEYVLGAATAGVLAVVAAAAGIGVVVAARYHPRTFALAALTVAHVGVYALLLPVEGHGGRYQPLVPGVFMALAVLGAVETLQALVALSPLPANAGRRRLLSLLASFLAVAGLAWGTTTTLLRWGRDHWRAVSHIQLTEEAAGRFIAGLPPGKVASFDIGAIGYLAGRPVIDLGALVDPARAADLAEGRTVGRMAQCGVEYVALPMGYSDWFPDPWNFAELLGVFRSKVVELEKVAEFKSPPPLWSAGLRATLHSAPRQVIFRLHWRGVP